MADINTFYPPARLANLATLANLASAVDDSNSVADISFYAGAESAAPFRVTNGATSAPSSASSLTITSADILANSFVNGDVVYVTDDSKTNIEKQGSVTAEGAGTVTINMDAAFTASDTTDYTVGKRTPNKLYITF